MAIINARAFHELMALFGPFEDEPHLAVAVSGGADSMALVLLADSWVRDQGGAVTALTVDHGLRSESEIEIRQVGDWLKYRAIYHKILRWKGKKPLSGIQAAARQARYDLMTDWCQRHAILHLLVAHHGDDQAETVLLRREKNSGPDGLSGMAPGRALNGVRLIRPFLTRRRKDMEATLTAWQQPWLEDPSNTEARFARTAVRRKLKNNEQKFINLQNLSRKATEERRRHSRQRAALAAQIVRMHPAGFCWLDGLEGSDELLAKSLLGDILLCVGGGIYKPKRERLERLYKNMTTRSLGSRQMSRGHTLAGTRILPRASGFLICRETGRLPPPIYLNSNCTGRWDRFVWKLRNVTGQNLHIGPLGEAGWLQVRAFTRVNIPSQVRPGLPSLKQEGKVLAVPHLNFTFTENGKTKNQKIQFFSVFSPHLPMQPDGLLLV